MKLNTMNTTTPTKIESIDEVVSQWSEQIRQKCGGKLRLQFTGIDSWNRPIFTDRRFPKMFFGGDHLFRYNDDMDKVREFYRGMSLNEHISYFGSAFDCEPWGIPLHGIDVEFA